MGGKHKDSWTPFIGVESLGMIGTTIEADGSVLGSWKEIAVTAAAAAAAATTPASAVWPSKKSSTVPIANWLDAVPIQLQLFEWKQQLVSDIEASPSITRKQQQISKRVEAVKEKKGKKRKDEKEQIEIGLKIAPPSER
ncbi:hypothetical protein RJ639_013904 [Escallonia herrerae]|uniref:Uncharacterized protein n=1 Tax=Escallonia herrerae TaxID=1293975 RepID=A0AA88VHJ5_9ASTE|nr:hypothetical protein RJ639_013904 [Escallonia herrerae]